jgi:hypothetical protein
MKNEKITRGRYDEIIFSSIPISIQKKVKKLVTLATKANKVDEHGSWDFGCEFDNRGRGSALNWDLYAYGYDFHSRKLLVIIQIRYYQKAKKNYFPVIRKNYYLLGRNEDKTVFAHPIESRVVRHAVNNGKDPILAIQNWMFQCDYKKVIRQGDIALVPTQRPRGELITSNEIVLQDSHQLESEEIYLNGVYYVKNPRVKHLPNTHPEVKGEGWFKVMVSNRANYWKFAAPTVD